YRTRHPLVPHGMSVILTAPAAFRFTFATSPERHLRAAALLGAPVADLDEAEQREALPRALLSLMRDIGIPNGLTAIGYSERDIPALIEGPRRHPRRAGHGRRDPGNGPGGTRARRTAAVAPRCGRRAGPPRRSRTSSRTRRGRRSRRSRRAVAARQAVGSPASWGSSRRRRSTSADATGTRRARESAG